MSIIIGIIVALIIASILKNILTGLVDSIIKLIGLILVIGACVFLLSLLIKNIGAIWGIIGAILSFIIKIILALVVVCTIAIILFLIFMPQSQKNRNKIESEINKDIDKLSPNCNYNNLLESYRRKYKMVDIGDYNLDDIIIPKLNLFCEKNIKAVKDGVGKILSDIGMNEYNYVFDQCLQKYEKYCIGDEQIEKLISSEIDLRGEKIYLKDKDITLIKAINSTGGTTYVQNHFEID